LAETQGLNHLGLTVADLNTTTRFFVDCLGWEESGRDDTYPRTAVSDGNLRLTLWQVDRSMHGEAFDRKKNIGLHHVALTVPSEPVLMDLAKRVAAWPGVEVEFAPELVGEGPRKHMMFSEPGGIRMEFIWSGVIHSPSPILTQ